MPETYLEWNDAIATRLFRSELGGRQVLLFVSNDLIEDIGGPGSVPSFVAAVDAGPPWVPSHIGLCQKALKTLEGWRGRGLEYPPYVAYLALFVLAVGVAGPFPAHAYYPRLRALLGWPDVNGGRPPSFDRMLELWEDLEVWSNQDTGGALGVSSIRIVGEWIHVGLPKAQAILTESEVRALPALFASASLDPMAPPSDQELARALRRQGAHVLRPSTLDLLAAPDAEPELVAVLMDTVRSELESWDGVSEPRAPGQACTVSAVARVCLRIDEIGGQVRATLRIATHAEFPEDGLAFTAPSIDVVLECHEYVRGWSSTLREQATAQDLDAAALPWTRRLTVTDDLAGWQVSLPAARVRVFVSGASFDIPGYIEVRQVPTSSPFLLAVAEDARSAVVKWGDSGEIDLSRVEVRSGFPEKWALYKASAARSDSAIRDALPELALLSTIRLSLTGGIRSGQGTSFFRFAPPSVAVDGGSGAEDVYCEGRQLIHAPGSLHFLLPDGLPSRQRLTVEVRSSGTVIRRQSLFLSDEFPWQLRDRLVSIGRFGQARSDGERNEVDPAASGAAVGYVEALHFPVRPVVPPERRVFAIGRKVGQIRTLPAQSLSELWDPIWLVVLGRKGRVEYCGRDLATAGPDQASEGTAEEMALWKDVLWRRRKRITPPLHPALRTLWMSYVRAGSRV